MNEQCDGKLERNIAVQPRETAVDALAVDALAVDALAVDALAVDALEALSRELGEDSGKVEQSSPAGSDLAHVPESLGDKLQAVVPRGLLDSRSANLRLSQQHRFRAVRQYGDFTLAYNSAVQEGVEYHWSKLGYLAYIKRKGQVFVLGDPVADAVDTPKLLQEFLRQFPRPTFVQCSSTTAAHLESLGFFINEMGVDTILNLPTYSFAGKSMERIRYASNWLKKHGYSIAEATFADIDQDEVARVSESWRNGMRNRRSEMRFLNRPIVLGDELDVRKFFLRDAEGKLVAFIFFDPLYRDGQVIGYATAIKRRSPEAPLYAEQGIMRVAVEQFKLEGKQQVNLGLSPLAWIENKSYRRNPLLHFSFRYAFRAWWVNRFFYNLNGHAQYKRHFKGREVPYHYASPVLINVVRITNLMRLTGVY